MTDIREISFKRLVSDWADCIIDMYYYDVTLRTGETVYQGRDNEKDVRERRDVNQSIADKITLELLRRGKIISDLAAVVEAVTGIKLDDS